MTRYYFTSRYELSQWWIKRLPWGREASPICMLSNQAASQAVITICFVPRSTIYWGFHSITRMKKINGNALEIRPSQETEKSGEKMKYEGNVILVTLTLLRLWRDTGHLFPADHAGLSPHCARHPPLLSPLHHQSCPGQSGIGWPPSHSLPWV